VFTRARKFLIILSQISPVPFIIAYVFDTVQSVEFFMLILMVHKITTRCHVQQFNVLHTECTYVIFMDLGTNSDHYFLIDFCNETVYLLRGTNLMFQHNLV
jgi:hypothetical protein